MSILRPDGLENTLSEELAKHLRRGHGPTLHRVCKPANFFAGHFSDGASKIEPFSRTN